jgi:hypothetical protein
VLNNEATAAALDNRQLQLERAATQAALDGQATQTTVAFANVQQATAAALDFQVTQAAFDRIATQVELEYQGTRAALSRDATAAALGFATQPPGDILTQTPPSTFTPVPLFTDGFARGVDAALWEVSAPADWSLSTDGVLTARHSGAWMLTQLHDLRNYAVEVDLQPLQGLGLIADYYLLLNVQDDPLAPGALALRLSYDGERLTAAGLYHFTRREMTEAAGLINRALPAVESVQINIPPDERLNIRAEHRDSRVMVIVNGFLLLDLTLDTPPQAGAVGLQVPVGTRVERVRLLP